MTIVIGLAKTGSHPKVVFHRDSKTSFDKDLFSRISIVNDLFYLLV